MLDISQLSSRIADLSNQLSLDDFEDWFREESRDVHLWGDEELNEAVSAVEAVFSEHYHGGLDEVKAKKEMANTILPFVHVLRQESYLASWTETPGKRVDRDSESTSGDNLTFGDTVSLILSSPSLSQRFALQL